MIHVELDVKRSSVPHYFNTMDIHCVVNTKQAVYYFVVNKEVGLARITKLVRKSQRGYDCSTTMSVDQARKFIKQLQVKG
jgi:hypothetical protein